MTTAAESAEASSAASANGADRSPTNGSDVRASVLVVGEAMIDLLPAGADPAVMPGAQPFVAYPSGSPANTAVALARLGALVALAARVSHDPLGRMLRRYLESSGVDMSHVVDAAEATTLAVVGVTEAGDADYSFYTRGSADWQWTAEELPDRLDDSVTVVHAGSLALAIPPGGAVIEQFLSCVRGSCLISLDPNVRPALVTDLVAYRGALQRWVDLADIVKVSTEDLAVVYPDRAPLDVIADWADPRRLIALTRGSGGATILFAGDAIAVPGFAVEVADTIAAGDTFTAGLIQGLLDAGLRTSLDDVSTADVHAAARRGCAAAAVACARSGPNPPTSTEVAEFLAAR